MNIAYSSFILPLVGVVIVSTLIAIYTWLNRSIKGALPLFVMSISIIVWSAGYALEIMGVDLVTKYNWGVIQYIGIAAIPYTFLLFAVSFAEIIRSIPRRYLILAGVIPVITVLLALTTKWHGLIWNEYYISQQDAFSALGVSYGFWFFVHTGYSYLLLLIGAGVLVQAFFRKQGSYRRQAFAMLIATLAPWVGNALYITGNSPIPYLDLTPFAFTVTELALAWAVFENFYSAKQLAENELAIARRIQQSFLPADFSQVAGWNIDVRFQSAREVAGDFYDVFPVSNGARIALVVADVCDKGIGAAMYMAIFRTLIRAFANVNTTAYTPPAREKGDSDLAAITTSMRRSHILGVGAQPLLNAIQTTNQYIARTHGSSGMFATVFFGMLNPQDGKMIYINAGHEPPVLISEGGIKTRLKPTGPVIGIDADLNFEIGEVELKPGDLLFAYTDGFTDARNEKDEAFSEERMLALLLKYAEQAEGVAGKLMEDVKAFIGGSDQFDDLTALSLYRKTGG